MRIFENIKITDEQLQPIVEWCEKNKDFAPVVTKYNKKGNWTAISLKGYGADPKQIGKGGVLGTETSDTLQETALYHELNIGAILENIPAETDRVRLMRLEAGTKIAKHTDKVDKDIKTGKIKRLHIPVITDDRIIFRSWLDNGIAEFHMAKGECWWLDVAKAHAVENNSDIDRVHLVVDVINNETIDETLNP
jgi:hypothetical protein